MEHGNRDGGVEPLAGIGPGSAHAADGEHAADQDSVYDAEIGEAAEFYFVFQHVGRAGELHALPGEFHAGAIYAAGHSDSGADPEKQESLCGWGG